MAKKIIAKASNFETERLYMRPFKLSDAAQCIKLNWKDEKNKPIKKIDQAKKYLKSITKKYDGYYLGVFLKQTNELIGDLELCHLNWFDGQAGEICYGVGPDYEGKGYATEAAKGLIDYCFTKLNFHKVTADTDPDNLASQRVLEKLGFKLEGRLRDRQLINGKWVDELDYGLLKSEWKK